MSRVIPGKASVAVLVCFLLCVSAAWALDPLGERMAARLDELAFSEDPQIGEAEVAAAQVLTEFYARRDFRPAWNAAQIEQLLLLIGEVETYGLLATDYHLDEIELRAAPALRGETLDDAGAVDLDILLTESLLRLAYHRRFGKVDPNDLDADWNLSRSMDGRDPAEFAKAALGSGDLKEFVRDRMHDDVPHYERFRTALARYRQLATEGGWPGVPEGEVLKPGMSGPRVTDLQRRLRVTDDTLRASPQSDRFDEALEAAVVRFQRLHGLDADGVVGRQTLEALNVSVEERVDQIRVNLERTRWVLRDVEDEFLVVNIAGFRVYLVRDRTVAWSARAQVGKAYRKTPIFKGSMKYLVFNPTWTVPPTILAKDVVPAIKRDRSYLERKNMKLLDRGGRTVDPASIDWETVSPRGFPYTVRQDPGPTNSLGLVKFIFPNPHFVFLHDTPSRGLFERTERTFSSGCIRVENPFELAEILLDDPDKWNRERIDAVIASRETDTVYLADPITVMLLYWTVDLDPETGRVTFLRDVYDRDAAVLKALDGDFVFKPPEGFSAYGN